MREREKERVQHQYKNKKDMLNYSSGIYFSVGTQETLLYVQRSAFLSQLVLILSNREIPTLYH